MAEQTKKNREEYRQARDQFDSLKIEEKAIFMVESAFSMLAYGIESLGNLFSEQINKVYQEAETKAPKAEKESKAASKKSTTKSSTTRKRATSTRTRKPTPKKEE